MATTTGVRFFAAESTTRVSLTVAIYLSRYKIQRGDKKWNLDSSLSHSVWLSAAGEMEFLSGGGGGGSAVRYDIIIMTYCIIHMRDAGLSALLAVW